MKTTTKNTKLQENTKLQDYILIIESLIPADFCDSYINEYENSDEWQQSMINDGKGGAILDDYRNCCTITTSDPIIIRQNKDVRQPLDDKMFSYVSLALDKYKQKLNFTTFGRSSTYFGTSSDTGYDLLRYKKSCRYGEHIDHFEQDPKALTCSFTLSDDYEGGAFSFFNQEKIINPLKGSAVMFPSNFMFPHEVLPVTKGIRYSMVTWFK